MRTSGKPRFPVLHGNAVEPVGAVVTPSVTVDAPATAVNAKSATAEPAKHANVRRMALVRITASS
jgi:hypothetical protein